jgi:hypothetical protein
MAIVGRGMMKRKAASTTIKHRRNSERVNATDSFPLHGFQSGTDCLKQKGCNQWSPDFKPMVTSITEDRVDTCLAGEKGYPEMVKLGGQASSILLENCFDKLCWGSMIFVTEAFRLDETCSERLLLYECSRYGMLEERNSCGRHAYRLGDYDQL